MKSMLHKVLGGTLTLVFLFSVGLWYTNSAEARLDVLAIGAAMPEFSLEDSTGKTHTRAQYDGKIVVFNFCTHECPFSRGADPDINELAKTYAEKGVVFLGVDSNKDVTLDQIQNHIKDFKIPYPILKDVDNKLADKVGARVTPEIYIMGKDGKLVYHGAPDDRAGPSSVPTEHYLKDALDAMLADMPIEKTFVKAWGCGIKRAG